MELYVDEVLPRAAQVQRRVARIASQWHVAPDIRVVESAADLPIRAPDDARGLIQNGQVWIVASQHHAAVPATLAHEVVAHFGLRHYLGAAWGEFMASVNHGARGSCIHLQDIRSEVDWAYSDLDLTPAATADEMTAGIVERSTNPRTGQFEPEWPMLKRASAAVGLFRREWLYDQVPAKYHEVEGVLLLANDRMRHGGRLFGIGRRLRGWHTALVSKNWYDKPPMSLEESERLLRVEKQRIGLVEDLKTVGAVAVMLCTLGALLYSLVSFIVR